MGAGLMAVAGHWRRVWLGQGEVACRIGSQSSEAPGVSGSLSQLRTFPRLASDGSKSCSPLRLHITLARQGPDCPQQFCASFQTCSCSSVGA